MSRSGIILLVEDNPDDADLTRRAFERSKVVNEIVVAKDGHEALDYLFATGAFEGREPHRTPDVILLDLNLPRLNGLEVLQRVRADDRTRRLPVVILTSSNEENDVSLSYDFGANSFVRKAVDFAEFLVTARQLGVYWLVVNTAPRPAGTTQ